MIDFGDRESFFGREAVHGPNADASETARHPAPAGERKQVTVLFADIVGSTSMIHDLDVERTADVLDAVVRKMVRGVQAHGGLVTGVMGDGVKAIFGAPISLADHADRACEAALEIQHLAGMGKLRIRIGLNSGEVVMRALDLGVDGDYDAIGLPVHIASRLEQLARPGRICLSASTARLIENRFLVRRLGPAVPKGATKPIELFELVRRRPAQSRWKTRAVEGLTRLVGRTEQLGLLKAKIDSAAAGKGQLAVITGEPGAGKSRLVYELMRQDDLQGWIVMTAAAGADDVRSGFRPFADMLRTWLGIASGDALPRICAKLQSYLQEIGGVAQETYLALAVLLDVPTAEEASRLHDLPNFRRQLMNGLLDLVRRCAEQHPTLIIFEDIHWLDEDSLELLTNIASDVPRRSVFLVATCRPGPQANRAELAPFTTIPLAPLSESDARLILDARLGDHLSLEDLKDRAISRSQGTPLFLEEIAKSFIEDGTVIQRAGRYQAISPKRSIAVPDSIRAILAERVDRLPARRKEIMQVASVVGREVPVQLLCRLMACREADLHPDLQALKESGLLQSMGGDLEPHVVFNHVLTQEVTYSGLLGRSRKKIHGEIVAAYESLYADRLDEHVELLAHHASRAELWTNAAEYLQRAARKAIERSGHAKAVQFLAEALDAQSRSAESAASKEQRELELRLLMRVAFNAIGNYRERLKNLDRAQELARRTGRTASLPSLMVSRASVVLQLGGVSAAVELCAKAWKDAARHGDDETGVIAGYMLSRSYFYGGKFTQSVAYARKAMALLNERSAKARHGGGFGSSEVMLFTQLAQSQACLGHFADARTNGEAAIGVAERHSRDFDIGLASYGFGMVHLYAGNPGQAIPVLERGLIACEAGGAAQSIFAMLGGLLSYAHLQAGAKDAAVALCKRVLAYDEESYHHANWSRLYGAMIFRETGQAAASMALARQASATARKWGYVVQMAWSDLLLAQLSQATDPRQARRYLSRAIALCESIKMRPCLARCLIQSGDLYRQQNQMRRALTAIADGEKLARSIQMTV